MVTTYTQTRLFAKLGALGVGKVIVGESGVEGGDKIEVGLSGDGVAQSDLVLVTRTATGPGSRILRTGLGAQTIPAIPILGWTQGHPGVGGATVGRV